MYNSPPAFNIANSSLAKKRSAEERRHTPLAEDVNKLWDALSPRGSHDKSTPPETKPNTPRRVSIDTQKNEVQEFTVAVPQLQSNESEDLSSDDSSPEVTPRTLKKVEKAVQKILPPLVQKAMQDVIPLTMQQVLPGAIQQAIQNSAMQFFQGLMPQQPAPMQQPLQMQPSVLMQQPVQMQQPASNQPSLQSQIQIHQPVQNKKSAQQSDVAQLVNGMGNLSLNPNMPSATDVYVGQCLKAFFTRHHQKIDHLFGFTLYQHGQELHSEKEFSTISNYQGSDFDEQVSKLLDRINNELLNNFDASMRKGITIKFDLS